MFKSTFRNFTKELFPVFLVSLIKNVCTYTVLNKATENVMASAVADGFPNERAVVVSVICNQISKQRPQAR